MALDGINVVDNSLAAVRNHLVAIFLTLSSRLAMRKVFVTSPADAMTLRDEHNRFESIAAATAAYSSPPPSSDARMIEDWMLVATSNLPLHIGKRKDGCNEMKTTATIREEMRMLPIIGRHLSHTTINL